MSILDSARDLIQPDTGTECTLDADTVWECLRNERRRLVITHIADLDNEDGIQKSDLAETIARHENGGEYDYRDRQAVYVALHQNHLERLADHGIVTITRGRVAPGPNCRALAHVIQLVEQEVTQ